MDSRSAARILDLAEPRGSRRRAMAAFAVILAIAAHVAVAGGFPSSAPTAGSSPGRAAHLAAEQAHMKRLMAVGAVAISASAGALAQEAVQWRAEDGGNGHWYLVTAPNDPPHWEVARNQAVQRGGTLVIIGSESENQFVRSVAAASGAPRIWIGCRYVQGSGWRWLDGTEPTLAGWGGSSCQNGPYPNDPPYSGFAVAYANCDYADPTTPLVWDDFPVALIGYPPTPSVIEWSADCNADGIVDFGQIRAGELDDANGNNIPDCCENGTLCGCPGDANDDGAVDGIDLAIVLTRWGQPGAKFPEADCNDDGAIDGVDLSLVLGTWGACP